MRKRVKGASMALVVLGVTTVLAAGVAGNLDTTFDGDGLVEAADGARVSSTAVQADGKILVAGTLHASQLTEGDNGWLFRRYTTSGALDSGFGTGGEAKPFDSIGGARGVSSMILDGSGRILATGEALVDVLVQTGKGKNKTWTTEKQRHAVVICMTSAGTLDSNFGDGGVTLLEAAGLGIPSGRALALQSDGRIIVLGTGIQSSGSKKKKGGSGTTPNNVIFVGRLDADGTLDSSFGTDGYATKDLGYAVDVAVQSNDAIVVGSHESDEPGAGGWAIHRYDVNGTADSGFGTLAAPESDVYYGLSGIVIDANDRIVAGGLNNASGTQGSVVVRYGADGALDTTFGAAGIAEVGLATRNEGRGGLAIAADGSIVLAGTIITEYSSGPPEYEAYVARFTSQGALDVAFGAGGFGESLPLIDSQVAQALALTSGDDIVVAGIIEDFVDEAARAMFVARWCGN